MAKQDTNWKRDRRQTVVWLIVAAVFVLDEIVEDSMDHPNDLKSIFAILVKWLLMSVAVGLAIRAAREWGRTLERSETEPPEEDSD